MKKTFCLLALIILLCPGMNGQTFALATPSANPSVILYDLAASPNGGFIANFAYHHHKRNRKLIIGGIMSLGGMVISFSGGIMYALGEPGEDPYARNTGLQNAGIGVAAVGGAVLITGIILACIGKHEKNNGIYGLQLVSPRRNEIGVAYNF
jgi:hypothetical protein